MGAGVCGVDSGFSEGADGECQYSDVGDCLCDCGAAYWGGGGGGDCAGEGGEGGGGGKGESCYGGWWRGEGGEEGTLIKYLPLRLKLVL